MNGKAGLSLAILRYFLCCVFLLRRCHSVYTDECLRARKFENVGKGEIKYILLRFYLISILTSNALTLSLGCCEKLTTILKVNCIFNHDHYLFDKTQRVPLRCHNRDN